MGVASLSGNASFIPPPPLSFFACSDGAGCPFSFCLASNSPSLFRCYYDKQSTQKMSQGHQPGPQSIEMSRGDFFDICVQQRMMPGTASWQSGGQHPYFMSNGQGQGLPLMATSGWNPDAARENNTATTTTTTTSTSQPREPNGQFSTYNRSSSDPFTQNSHRHQGPVSSSFPFGQQQQQPDAMFEKIFRDKVAPPSFYPSAESSFPPSQDRMQG